MPSSIKRVQWIHALFVVCLITIIMWGFLTSWKDINQRLERQHPADLAVQYSYLQREADDLSPVSEALFTAAKLNEAPLHFGHINHWYQLRLTNQSNSVRDIVMIIDNPMADRLEIFAINEYQEEKLIAVLGDRVEQVDRSQRILPNVPLSLSPNEQITLRVHFETEGAPYLPFLFLDQDDYAEYSLQLHLIWGTFIGVILLMSAYNLVLYFGVGDRTYCLYICYISAMLIELGIVHGYGYYLFPEHIQLWLHQNVILFNTLAGYFALQFCLAFLHFNNKDGNTYRFTKIFSYLLLASATVDLFAPEYISAQVFSVFQLITYGFVIRLLTVRLGTSFRWAKYYLFSWIPFFFGAAIGFTLYSGLLDYSFLNRHALMFSVIFEMAFISMALADRLGDTERRRLYQATHDFKLGLANEGLLEQSIKKYSREYNHHGFTLITVEISNYDSVMPYVRDDQLGKLIHALGRSFASQIEQSLDLLKIDDWRSTHTKTALIRGEIFAYLARTDNKLWVENTLKLISNNDNFNPLQDEIPFRIQCVFGAAVWSPSNQEPLEIINQARRAISQANDQSSPYHIYLNDSADTSSYKVRLAQDLGNAIRLNQLSLYHQPQIYLHKDKQRSSEVLLRWDHPEMGPIPPQIFVEIAEEIGLIKQLTRWVLKTAFAQTKILSEQKMDDINVAINISAYDLSRNGFVEEIQRLLTKHHVSPEFFTLELTETAHLTDRQTFEDNFLRLQRLGFQFAIDDFGTGYSSLTYTNDHPFTELKIDRSFITNLLNTKKQQAIVTATISMAKELGLLITAEGVEDEPTYRALKALGCDKIQGYLFAKPMPFEEYLSWQLVTHSEVS